jgi:predicted helicase
MREEFVPEAIRTTLYRPFVKRVIYDSKMMIDERGPWDAAFPNSGDDNVVLALLVGNRQPFSLVAAKEIPNFNLYSADTCSYLPRWRYLEGASVDNITDWALKQFRAHYEKGTKPKRRIDKDAIFHYVYGVLHDPIYRERYALNLKREFPRIPFYPDFWKWAEWGEALMALHIGYETAEPFPLERVEAVGETAKKSGIAPKAILKALKDSGTIVLDSETQLTGVPPEAWDYRLGNRSALEWILDQYKEKTPKDPTIREKFNTYRFADYKDHVISLLQKVARVSVETQHIVKQMSSDRSAR